MKIICTTSNKYRQAVPIFAHLFNKYWGDDRVDVIGALPPDKPLPDNFTFHSVGDDWPKDKFTNHLIELFARMRDNYFVWLLEDYWIARPVPNVRPLQQLMSQSPTPILRIDLTNDRRYNGACKDIGKWDIFDIVETAPPSEYHMSLQAGIWNRDLLLQVLKPDWDPWQVELQGTTIANEKQYRVLGTKQCPVKYVNAYNNAWEGCNTNGLSQDDIDELKGMGLI